MCTDFDDKQLLMPGASTLEAKIQAALLLNLLNFDPCLSTGTNFLLPSRHHTSIAAHA